ncbi:DUF1566 domain-containing protein [Psychroserpens jangbogonensis]|uniref:DUF1566 domain-containing protein n=1 Tax=Psychroserpens jangbogonensis TaxID=1484460 RepID=UPI0006895603|nr:DUF1566 domain-containing protein [Psychroserpens jangbogonensis]
MKKLYTLVVALVMTASTFAQAPEKMSYQAVVRDAGNAIVSNQAVGMQISILQDATAVYVETQTPTTNANGLVSIQIGMGSVVSGDFSAIDWSAGPYFIKTETDPTGGTTYTITGTSELLSVPYALHSKIAATLPGGINQAYIEALEARITALEPPPPPATVGDLRDGGVVFWVDPADNTHGLVCALSDISFQQWGCAFTDLPSVPTVTGFPPSGSGAEIGDGITNTNAMLADCPTAPAALAARSLGPEWFLPSINELKEIYLNRATLEAVSGVAAFSNDYWSSTELDGPNAWSQFFTNGIQTFYNKSYMTNVRAVRAF